MSLTAQTAIILLSLLLALGFVWGLSVNRRLARQFYRELRQTLEGWGRIAGARWLGGATSGIQVTVEEARAPWRRIEAIALLEPREFLPIWVWARWARGQRDALLLRITLRRQPRVEWEWRAATWQPLRGFPPPRPEEGFTPYTLQGYQGWSRPQVEQQEAQQWQDLLQTYSGSLRALSLRRQKPHLILEVRWPGARVNAFLDDLYRALQPWV